MVLFAQIAEPSPATMQFVTQILTALFSLIGICVSAVVALNIARLTTAQNASTNKLAQIDAKAAVAATATEVATVKDAQIKKDLVVANARTNEVMAALVGKVGTTAVKVQELATGQAQTNDKVAELTVIATDAKKTTEAVHILVNSGLSRALKVGMDALDKIAEITNLPADHRVAELARANFEDHEAKQKILDGTALLQNNPPGAPP
jgi:hypothetical protein